MERLAQARRGYADPIPLGDEGEGAGVCEVWRRALLVALLRAAPLLQARYNRYNTNLASLTCHPLPANPTPCKRATAAAAPAAPHAALGAPKPSAASGASLGGLLEPPDPVLEHLLRKARSPEVRCASTLVDARFTAGRRRALAGLLGPQEAGFLVSVGCTATTTRVLSAARTAAARCVPYVKRQPARLLCTLCRCWSSSC